MKKRILALALAGIFVCSSAFTGFSVNADAADAYVTVDQLQDNKTAAPEKDKVVPDANQYEYHKQELSAFCHFGPNTFNEIEWGENYGNRTPDSIFKLEDNFDADLLVSTLKEAGFMKLIVTAKHHDGFCIWNSAYTEYDVESTSYADYNYDGLKGDVLAEISAACTKYDMDMGLYLSPWDIHEPSYGYYDANGRPTNAANDVLDYNEFYNNQLKEILSNPIYGNDGHFNEIWMDGAKGSGANAQDYTFEQWFNTIQKYEGKEAGYEADCMLFGAYEYTGVRWIGNESGYAAEETWAQCWAYPDREGEASFDANQVGEYRKGFPDGNIWTVPEADARITSGWFWGTTKATPKTVEALAEMYFRSVGHNATLLLNVPPNNKGTVDQAILDRVTEFGENVKETFQVNMATVAVNSAATAAASEVRGNDLAYKPGNVLDGDDATYWTVNDGTTTGTLVVDLGAAKTFDVVSIEESIEFGQRINKFKVEYRNGDDDWKVFDEGTTIGSKRLSRKNPVKADQLRITVSTASAVPMIAEIGVYKASEGFELGAAAPDGIEVINDRDAAFKFTGSWNPETGTQYLGETNRWCNAGASFEVSFTGTKIYLIGTEDPGHGTADIYIDGTKVTSINTKVSPRQVGQVIYESDTLSDEAHTLKLAATGTIGIEGAYVINNGGLGMIGIEQAKYTMEEDSELEVKLIRAGGTKGEAVVEFTPNPGSAIQDDYDTEANYVITFADGETEKTAVVRTKRNTNRTGTQYFTVELASSNENLILGFNSKARINITDAEELTAEKLQELVDLYKEEVLPMYQVYTADSWAALETAFNTAVEKLEKGDLTLNEVKNAYEALEAAKAALTARDTETGIYTADDRFQFPGIDEMTVLEMEYTERHNNEEGDNGWPLMITENEWASNGRFLNCLNGNDEAVLHYNAPRKGTYSAVVTYRSGDSANSIVWSEANDKITAGNVSAGANDSAGATHTAEFEFVVTEAGEGTLTFKGGDRKAPQIDKIEITAKDVERTEFKVTKTVNGNGKIEGPETVKEASNAEFTFKGEEGYEVKDVKVNGVSVGAVDSYIVEYVNGDIEIEVVFDIASDELPLSAIVAATAGNEELNGGAAEGPAGLVIDNNTSTKWHTDWYPEAGNSYDDHWVQLELDEVYAVTGLKYLPRQDSSTNGDITKYKVLLSEDGEEWTVAAEGEFDNGKNWSEVSFTAQNAKYVRLQAVETLGDQGDKHFTSAAEVRVIGAEALAEEPADPASVRKLESLVKGALTDLSKYTEESAARYQNAVDAAKAVIAKENPTQREVDKAYSALWNAALSMEEKPAVTPVDKDALNKAIAAAEALNADDYTEESWKAVAENLTYAKNIAATETISQAEVDLAAEELNAAIKALEAKDEPIVPPVEDDEVVRLFGQGRYDTAYAVADALKEALGVEKFEAVVVATGKNFADALAGSYLAVEKNAPILLTNGKDDNVAQLHAYIAANVAEGGKIYILGGEAAVPAAVEAIDGYEVERLFGDSRYDTNLAILEEAGVTGDSVIVATGKTFADSLSASAAKLPILLVKPDGTLNDAQKDILAGMKNIYIVGGDGAVSADYEAELEAFGTVTRVFGESRYDTSVEVAKTFCKDVDFAVVASGKNFPDGLCGGPLAAALNAPLVLTKDGGASAAAGYVAENGIASGYVLGGDGALADETVVEVFALESAAEIK